MDVYPVVMSFVGKEWLEAALKLFVTQCPPKIACLAHYGGDFADFLMSFGPAQTMPYLADIARLEWAVHECQNMADEEALSGDDWAAMAGPDAQLKVFSLVNAHRFIGSDYPLLDLWQLGNGADADKEIDLENGGMTLLVIRPVSEVVIVPLEISEYTFLNHLQRGETLLAAATAVEWAHDASPLADTMMRYAASKFFKEMTLRDGDKV